MASVVSGILKSKMKNMMKTRTQKIVEDCGMKFSMFFSSWQVFSGHLQYFCAWNGM